MMIWLVVTGTMECYDFPYIGNGIIIPTDELIFFRGVETTNQPSIIAVFLMLYEVLSIEDNGYS